MLSLNFDNGLNSLFLGASDAEKEGAKQVATELGADSPKTIVEGKEGGPFWDDLGGKATYSTDPRPEV